MPILSELLYKKSQRGLSTGNSVLDVGLSGSRDGLKIPSFTEISGPPGCGKTTIILLLLLDALKAGRKCLWVNAGYRSIPIERLKNMAGYEDRYEKYLDFISLSDLAELSLLPTIVGDQYDVILLPSYYDVFPPIALGPIKKRTIGDSGSQYSFEARKAARTVLHSVFSQLSEKSCLILTSNMVSIHDPTNRQLRVLQPPLQFKSVNLFILYRGHQGETLTGNGCLLDFSSGTLTVSPAHKKRIALEHVSSSFNDSQILSSPMAKQTPVKARPLDLDLASDPPDESPEIDGIVFNSQLEYTDFPVQKLPKRTSSSQPLVAGPHDSA